MQPYSFSGVRVRLIPFGVTVTVAGSYLPERPARTWGPPDLMHDGSPEEIEIERAEVEIETADGGESVIDLMQLPEWLSLADQFWNELENGVSTVMKRGARYAA